MHDDKIKVGVVGLGKMGLSHFAIVNAHPDVRAVACDSSGYIIDGLRKNTAAEALKDYDELIADPNLDAVVIATPSRTHAPMVRKALERNLHVFCEKPFCLDPGDSTELAGLAAARNRVAQVGYHNRYVAAFCEAKRILDSGALGNATQVLAEAYGPVVLRPKGRTWRTQKLEGGGCLYDYAAHPLNLLNWYFGAPHRVSGSVLNRIHSAQTDDAVCSTVQWGGGPTAQLSVNWTDDSHRKMTTRISVIGTNGRLFVDRQECQVYLREPHPALPEFGRGWTIRYTTELTSDQWFYLRGEEYSAQIADFIAAIRDGRGSAFENDFASAAETDRCLAMIVADAEHAPPSIASSPQSRPRSRGGLMRWWPFGRRAA